VANSSQAKKRARQAEVRRRKNASMRSMVRTEIKRVGTEISSGNKEEAQKNFLAAQKVIDRMADKGIIHKNKASRHKSRLNKKIKAL
jgi:small subunit ribosomal protein S20